MPNDARARTTPARMAQPLPRRWRGRPAGAILQCGPRRRGPPRRLVGQFLQQLGKIHASFRRPFPTLAQPTTRYLGPQAGMFLLGEVRRTFGISAERVTDGD